MSQQIIMTIEVKVLSFDSIPALLCEHFALVQKETVSGEFTKEDGDAIKWDTKYENIKL